MCFPPGNRWRPSSRGFGLVLSLLRSKGSCRVTLRNAVPDLQDVHLWSSWSMKCAQRAQWSLQLSLLLARACRSFCTPQHSEHGLQLRCPHLAVWGVVCCWYCWDYWDNSLPRNAFVQCSTAGLQQAAVPSSAWIIQNPRAAYLVRATGSNQWCQSHQSGPAYIPVPLGSSVTWKSIEADFISWQDYRSALRLTWFHGRTML